MFLRDLLASGKSAATLRSYAVDLLRWWRFLDAVDVTRVGFQNSATAVGLGFYAARSYSLRRPPRMGRRWIRSWERSAAGWSGWGGRSWRLRWGRRPL